MSFALRILPLLLLTACHAEGPAPEPLDEVSPSASRTAHIVQPASAHSGLRNVLEVLSEMKGEESWIELRSIAASTREESVDVRMELAIHAPDDVLASQLYARLIDALESAPWSRNVGRSETEPLSDGRGLEVNDLRVSVACAPVERHTVRTGTIEPLIREVSVRPEVALGPVVISPSTKRPDASTLDRHWRIRPAVKSGSDLKSILVFASLLEEVGRDHGVVVTQIDLTPSTRREPAARDSSWAYQMRTTIREGVL